MGVLERKRPFRELAVERQRQGDDRVEAIVFGLGRYGSRLLVQLRAAGVKAIGVDFDPEAVRALRRQHLPVRFGDGENTDFVESLPLSEARWVITTFPDWESNRALLHALKASQFSGQVAGAVRDVRHGQALQAAGVQYILNPFDDAADHAAQRLAGQIHSSTEDTP